MPDLVSRLNNKVQEKWFSDCIENLTKSANQEGFYKASQEIAPMIEDLKDDIKIEIDFPYGTSSTTVGQLKKNVNHVLEVRQANQEHYSAIEKANTILALLETFSLDGVKPDNKRGAPKKERKLNI